MISMRGGDVEQAVAESVRVLADLTTLDWGVPAGTLAWDCWTTAAHIAHDLVAYAGQVAARPADGYLPFDLVVRPGTPPGELLTVIRAAGALLSGAVASAPANARGWHWGPTDPAGFAALGVSETLVHTYDIVSGLGVDWFPPAPLCAAVLARLFPGAPAGDPARVLLWSTGRLDLDDRPRVTSWTLRAALD